MISQTFCGICSLDGKKQFPILEKWEFLSLAYLERWKDYDILLEKTAISRKKFYIWLKVFFRGGEKDLNEATKILTPKTANVFQMQFIDFKNTESNVAVLKKTMQQVLFGSLDLYSLLGANKDQFSPRFFELAIGEVARQAFLRGDFLFVGKLFRSHYSSFSRIEAKEKLMLYYGLSLFYGLDRKEGETMLLKILYYNPQSVYRFQVLATLEKFL